MQIRILCVGKIKEQFYRDAVSEYVKRLGRYAKVSIMETADEKTPERASDAENRLIREKEGGRILKAVGSRDYVAALDMRGREMDSVSFAYHFSEITGRGFGTVDFIIGGSLGLDANVIKRADETISFSKMTFPHQLMRVILLEQIYRSFRIINNEPYHK